MVVGTYVETACWTVVCCAVWLATLSSVTVPELCLALLASIPCGILARAGRRALEGSWCLRPRWLLWVLPVAGSLVAETVVLLRDAATRPRSGRLRTLELPDEPTEIAAGREALGTLALSATPGTMVADCEPSKRQMTVHALSTAGPEVEEAIRR